MTFQTIDVQPLSSAIGAEIFGVDLSQDLSQETFSEIQQAFLDHLVIFFRDQDLTVDQQISFARRFGPLLVDPFIAGPDDRPELMVVAREKHEQRAFGENWHSDNSYLDKPPLGSFLYGVEIPPHGGDTLFANQYQAFETLSPGLQAVLEKLCAVHAPRGYHKAIAAGQFDDGSMKLRDDELMEQTLTAEATHPVVRTHPQTGRKALYINKSYTVGFKDWTEAESRPLLDFLIDYAVKPEFSCRFRWQPKSMALWDNRCAMHLAINDVHGYRRVMHRVVAEGDRPY
jgi:taurine dioxygenase